MSGQDVFPTTRKTWVELKLQEGPTGRAALNRHLMDLYALPLKIYILGSTYRNRYAEDADDLVRGFFADRLSRADFVQKWTESGKRLRFWLINALSFYLQELSRKRFPNTLHEHVADLPIDGEVEKNFDRAFKVELVRRALVMARDHCRAEGLETHWRVFVRHRYEGLPYGALTSEFAITAERAAAMSRTATVRFREAIRELLIRDGVSRDRIDDEIRLLCETS